MCAAINLFVLPFTEGWAPFQHLYRIGPVILLTNAAVAFCLNIAAVFLIGAGSGLVLTLAGVFKVSLESRVSEHAADSQPVWSSGHPLDLRLCGHLRSGNRTTANLRLRHCTRRVGPLQDFRREVKTSTHHYTPLHLHDQLCSVCIEYIAYTDLVVASLLVFRFALVPGACRSQSPICILSRFISYSTLHPTRLLSLFELQYYSYLQACYFERGHALEGPLRNDTSAFSPKKK